MDYRAEDKYIVSDADLALEEKRIHGIMRPDEHQKGSAYEIRSLYFDDLSDSCMDENEAGVDARRKYRIRVYGNDMSLIRLEVKEKLHGFTRKISCPISREEFDAIMDGSLAFTPDNSRKALNLFMLQLRCYGLRPKVIIVYERSAYVYPAGNVRVTFDRNILASSCCSDFFSENISGLVPVMPPGKHVLEVKYDEFLADFIAAQLETGNLSQTAFSKYYLGRLAVRGEFAAD